MSMADDWRGAGDWDDLLDEETLKAQEARQRQVRAAASAKRREREAAQRLAAGKPKRVVDMGFWTEFRVARLKKLWAEGVPGSAIARLLEAKSPSAVYGKADRLGLPVRLDLAHPGIKHMRRVHQGAPSRPEAGGRSPSRAQAQPSE